MAAESLINEWAVVPTVILDEEGLKKKQGRTRWEFGKDRIRRRRNIRYVHKDYSVYYEKVV